MEGVLMRGRDAIAVALRHPDGRIVTATRDNEHRQLFLGFPNSYGTLGYALRVKARTIPVKPYVHLTHLRFSDGAAFFRELEALLKAGAADFVDGTVFGEKELYVTLGRFQDEAPRTSDYTFENIYYRSIREKQEDWLTVKDYLWRWDTDWFWCSKNVFAQNALVRRFLYGKERLGSKTYTKIMRWNSRVGITRKVEKLVGLHSESVIQDVDIPIARAAEFLDFYAQHIARRQERDGRWITIDVRPPQSFSTFTATALGMLVEEGKIAWDAPVVQYLPAFALSDPYVTAHLTVRDLLVRVDARRARVADRPRRDLRRLGHDQPRRGPLRVVGRHRRGRRQPRSGPTARHRRHHDPIRQLHRPDSYRHEQIPRVAHCVLPFRPLRVVEVTIVQW